MSSFPHPLSYVTQCSILKDSIELTYFLPYVPCAGIIGVSHYAWVSGFYVVLGLEPSPSYSQASALPTEVSLQPYIRLFFVDAKMKDYAWGFVCLLVAFFFFFFLNKLNDISISFAVNHFMAAARKGPGSRLVSVLFRLATSLSFPNSFWAVHSRELAGRLLGPRVLETGTAH